MKYKAVMKMVFATGNSGKLREASEILGKGFELVTPAQMGISLPLHRWESMKRFQRQARP